VKKFYCEYLTTWAAFFAAGFVSAMFAFGWPDDEGTDWTEPQYTEYLVPPVDYTDYPLVEDPYVRSLQEQTRKAQEEPRVR